MTKLKKVKLLGLAGLALTCLSAEAGPNLLINGSFENTAGTFVNSGIGGDTGIMDLLPGSTAIPGWIVLDGGSGHDIGWGMNGNNYGIAASQGSYALDLTGYANSPAYSGVDQVVSTVAGQNVHSVLRRRAGTAKGEGWVALWQ